MATNVNLDNKLTTLKQVKSALAERDFNINELNEDLQNVKTVHLADDEPVNDNAVLWIDTKNTDEFSVPEIKDDTENNSDTWSSKKISNEINGLKSDLSEFRDELESGIHVLINADYNVGYIAVSTGVISTTTIRGIFATNIKSGSVINVDDTSEISVALYKYNTDGTFVGCSEYVSIPYTTSGNYVYAFQFYYKSTGLYSNITVERANALLGRVSIVSPSSYKGNNANINSIESRLGVVEPNFDVLSKRLENTSSIVADIALGFGKINKNITEFYNGSVTNYNNTVAISSGNTKTPRSDKLLGFNRALVTASYPNMASAKVMYAIFDDNGNLLTNTTLELGKSYTIPSNAVYIEIALYAFESDGSAITLRKDTFTQNGGKLGITFFNEGKILIDKVENETSLSEITAFNTCGKTNTFEMTSTTHSSTLDRIFANIECGTEFVCDVKADVTNLYIQVFALTVNGNSKQLASGNANNKFDIVADDDYIAIGIYASSSVVGATCTFTIYSKDALAARINSIEDIQEGSKSIYSLESYDDIEGILKNNTSSMIGVNSCDSFLFFTDPHWLGNNSNINGKIVEKKISIVGKIYNSSPCQFAVCGGDWLNGQDNATSASYKLSYAMKMCKQYIATEFYSLVGNHDTNSHGIGCGGDPPVVSPDVLSVNDMENAMYFGKCHYYTIEGNNTMYYCIDTGDDWDASMSSYERWEQVDWFATKLKEDDSSHSALLLHMVYAYGSTSVLNSVTLNFKSIIDAYNNRESVSLHGKIYNFNGCNGYVEFVLGGHHHADISNYFENVPYICTINIGDANIPNLDLITVNYDTNKIILKRVGTGQDRELNLFSKSLITN